MIRKRSSLSVWALFLVLALPGALGAQDKFKKPPVSQNQAILKLPYISSVEHQHLGDPWGEFILKGVNFTPQGSRNVQVDGTIVTHYYFPWSSGSIDIHFPVPYYPWDHVYQFCIVSDGKVISNIFSQRFLYHIEQLNPNKGPVGTEVKLADVFRLPASPGGLVLKIGTYNMSVTSWVGGDYGKITAKVPAGVSPGDYDVYLQKGSDVVSNKMKFKVQYPPVLLP